MNLIKDRDARTKKRQKAKEKFDKNITLAVINENKDKKFTFAANTNGNAVRLLDEGAIVTASGDLDLYIKKGTIQKFYNGKNKYLDNLTDSYEGTINIGHNDFATFPFIVGTWKKEDLKVVSNGEGRHGLDVDLHLNSAHPLVQALRVQDIPVGVSVEMYLDFDEKASEKEQIPIVDEIFIADFAIVGECGNVGSSGSVDLQGVKMDEEVKDIEEVIEDSELEEVAEENEMPVDVEDTEETEEVEEIETEETEEAVGEDAVDTAEVEETEEAEEDESVDEEVADEVVDEEGEDEEDALAVAEETIESLKAENEALKEQVEALKKSNKKKDNKIKEYAERNAEFTKKFKGLSVSMGITKEVKKDVSKKLYANGDGIGE